MKLEKVLAVFQAPEIVSPNSFAAIGPRDNGGQNYAQFGGFSGVSQGEVRFDATSQRPIMFIMFGWLLAITAGKRGKLGDAALIALRSSPIMAEPCYAYNLARPL